MNPTTLILALALSLPLSSCAQNFSLTQHFDAKLPFEIIDQQHPSGELYQAELRVSDARHEQLVEWMKNHATSWEKAPHNTFAGLIIVSQDDFRLLIYRNDDKVIAAYDDENGEMQQYIRKMDSNELSFLLEE